MEVWHTNGAMMQDGRLTVAPIVGDGSTTWGFAEAGVFWTGQDMLPVGVIGPVCAGPFTSITKAASAAKHKADVSDGSVEDDGEMQEAAMAFLPDMSYQQNKASTPTGQYCLRSTELQAFEDKTAFLRSIQHLNVPTAMFGLAGTQGIFAKAVEQAESHDFAATPQPVFVVRSSKKKDPLRLYRLRGSLAGLVRPTSDSTVANCECRLVTAGQTKAKTEYLHVFATKQIRSGAELRVFRPPFIAM